MRPLEKPPLMQLALYTPRSLPVPYSISSNFTLLITSYSIRSVFASLVKLLHNSIGCIYFTILVRRRRAFIIIPGWKQASSCVIYPPPPPPSLVGRPLFIYSLTKRVFVSYETTVRARRSCVHFSYNFTLGRFHSICNNKGFSARILLIGLALARRFCSGTRSDEGKNLLSRFLLQHYRTLILLENVS